MLPIKIEQYQGILVVRDDVIVGGTKARVVPMLFDSRKEYVYASPVQGYAQVALACCAREHGKRATIFCAARKTRHARTLEAMKAGARVVEVSPGYLSVARKRAKDYCEVSGSRLLPFGLDTPGIRSAIADVARRIDEPQEVWTVAGSGTLTLSLQMAWPNARFNAVRIGAMPNVGRAKIWAAPEKFDDPAKTPPPFPSCSNYDAKAWRFVKQHASPGALFWNVAR